MHACMGASIPLQNLETIHNCLVAAKLECTFQPQGGVEGKMIYGIKGVCVKRCPVLGGLVATVVNSDCN